MYAEWLYTHGPVRVDFARVAEIMESDGQRICTRLRALLTRPASDRYKWISSSMRVSAPGSSRWQSRSATR